MKTMFLAILITAALLISACTRNSASSQPENNWTLSTQAFIHQGFSPQAGDEVWVRLFDETGKELVFEKFPISNENLSSWQSDITKTLNEGPANQYLQVRQDPTGYLNTSTNSNYVWLKNPNHTYIIGLDH